MRRGTHPDGRILPQSAQASTQEKKLQAPRLARPPDGSSRKEVFQPHLPVRLPCYDLAPVTTFALGRVRPRLQAPAAPMA